MMKRLASAVALLSLGATGVVAQSAQTPATVVELFTSQGCSSCPPADKLVGELAEKGNVIVLSLPVDYWDYLGWKDTLALAGHGKRQRAYSQARGDREVYTPQIVVNGSLKVLGSDVEAVNAAIETSRQTRAVAVKVAANVVNGRLKVQLPAGDFKGSAQVWLCPVTGEVPVTIPRGENRGKTVSYHNVVRRWVRLGEWNGEAKTLEVSTQDLPETANAAAILVQSGPADQPGSIVGATMVALR